MNLHDEAMDIAEAADVLRRRGNVEGARRLFGEAFELAERAARTLKNRSDYEPTRSIFYRSAASLALEAGETKACESLVCEALLGTPPFDIANDLRDIWTQSSFEHHLLAQDIRIGEPEIIVSLWGGDSGAQLFRFDQVLQKLDATQTIAVRTAERLAGKQYRDYGRPAFVNRHLPIYTMPAMSRSFAVAIRFGEQTRQLPLFPDLNPTSVAEEMFACLQAVADRSIASIRGRFKEPAYYRNFVATARVLAPAKRSDPFVGVMTAADGVIKRTVLARAARTEIDAAAPLFQGGTQASESLEFTGKLLLADAVTGSKNVITLVDRDSQRHDIVVQKGLMRDVVTKYFDQEVLLRAIKRRGLLFLKTIDSVDLEAA